MRLLHTSDWHLGRSLHEASLLDEQAHALDQFVALTADVRPDVVVIAGDIYDRAIPPPEAVTLLDDVLWRLAGVLARPVVIIAGNHDGPERLGFGARAMAAGRVFVAGPFTGPPAPLVFADGDGPVILYPLPYADPPLLRARLSETPEPIDNHDAGFGAVLDRVRAAHPAGTRSVLMAHAFVAGGAESESERPLVLGGSGRVAPERLAGFTYCALGHLHRPQTVAPAVRYSGSLLKYSFDEATQPKSVSVVDIDAAGRVTVEEVALSPRRDVRILTGPLDDLLTTAPVAGREDYILARLEDRGLVLDALPRLRAVYPNILAVERPGLGLAGPDGGGRATTAGDHRRIEPIDLFAQFHRHVTGEDLEGEDRDPASERGLVLAAVRAALADAGDA